MAKYLIVDPPSGWLYGFPKVLSRVDDKDTIYTVNITSYENVLKDLLKLSGYPEKDLELNLKHCRYWVHNNIE